MVVPGFRATEAAEIALSLVRASLAVAVGFLMVNARERRTGTLWEGRYRATPIDTTNTSGTAVRCLVPRHRLRGGCPNT